MQLLKKMDGQKRETNYKMKYWQFRYELICIAILGIEG